MAFSLQKDLIKKTANQVLDAIEKQLSLEPDRDIDPEDLLSRFARVSLLLWGETI